MKATMLDMRRDPGKIIDAIARNERVILSVRGKDVAEVLPLKRKSHKKSIVENPAFGMWSDREDMADPTAYVRDLRKGRTHDL